MKDATITPIAIGILIGLAVLAAGILYFVVFGFLPGGWILRAIVTIGTVAVLFALGYVVRERIQEIRKENPDDYRKY